MKILEAQKVTFLFVKEDSILFFLCIDIAIWSWVLYDLNKGLFWDLQLAQMVYLKMQIQIETWQWQCQF